MGNHYHKYFAFADAFDVALAQATQSQPGLHMRLQGVLLKEMRAPLHDFSALPRHATVAGRVYPSTAPSPMTAKYDLRPCSSLESGGCSVFVPQCYW